MSTEALDNQTLSLNIKSNWNQPLQQLSHLVTRAAPNQGQKAIAQVPINRTTETSFPVYMPWTGEVIGSVPACTDADVQLALQKARQAQRRWVQQPMRERQAIFLRYHDLVLQRQGELLNLVQIESGKARCNALEEVLDVAINSRYYAIHAKSYLKPRRRQGAFPLLTSTQEHYHPVGVVGIIAPWNYPLTLAVSDAIPALMAGNAVVLKPALETPFIALFAVQLLEKAGLPEDLFQVVTGRGDIIGPPLIAGVNFLCFTGSSQTGRAIASQAGERLIPCSMELGGKNPMLVLNDADLDQAVAGAVQGCFANAGQLCVSCERLYVQSGIYQRFLQAFVERTRALRLGASLDYEADVGSLIDRQQLLKVDTHVRDAVAQGATVLIGGRTRPDIGPLFYEPTILTGVLPQMQVAQSETFGPVVTVYRFEDTEAAVQAANDSSYGLNASVWTRNTRMARQVAQQLQCGTVNINEAYAATWASVDAPMGGMKGSGIGRRHGRQGILKYTEPQTIAAQRWLAIAPPLSMNRQHYAWLMTAALRFLRHIPGWR